MAGIISLFIRGNFYGFMLIIFYVLIRILTNIKIMSDQIFSIEGIVITSVLVGFIFVVAGGH